MAWTDYTDTSFWTASGQASWNGSGWDIGDGSTANEGVLTVNGSWADAYRPPYVRLTVVISPDYTESETHVRLLEEGDIFWVDPLVDEALAGSGTLVFTFPIDWNATDLEFFSFIPGYDFSGEPDVYEVFEVTKIEFGSPDEAFWSEFYQAEEQLVA